MSETTYTYQLTAPMPGIPGDPPILRLPDNAFIPQDPANRDFQEFLTWLSKGNKPDPAPPLPRPEPQELQPLRVGDPEAETDAVNQRTLDARIDELNARIDGIEQGR